VKKVVFQVASRGWRAVKNLLGATALLALAGLQAAYSPAEAQGLTVLPVSIQLVPGQMATALTVINQTDSETAFQVRAFAWAQSGAGDDQLTPTNELLASPPLGTIGAGATQVVRLVLRRPASGHEAAYRILLDQIPPPASPGTVRIALRLSIPVFAEPAGRVAPHVQWRIENDGRQALLVAVNDGTQHETARDLALGAAKVDAKTSPYILAGATRRWRILSPSALSTGASLRLTGRGDAGGIDESVQVVAGQ
jgi:fimbrial chaperone protein